MQVAWSFAKMEHFSDDLMDAVATRLGERTAEFDGKSASGALWALARHGGIQNAAVLLPAIAEDLGPRAKVKT